MRDPETKLTMKQRRWSDIVCETGNGTQAALQVYGTDDPAIAASISSENYRKPKVYQYISQQCKIVGLTVPKVLMRLAEELDAERTVISPTGKLIGKEPDHGARHRAVVAAVKYVLPEFAAARQPGGAAVSRHLHLHSVPDAVLRKIAESSDSGDE